MSSIYPVANLNRRRDWTPPVKASRSDELSIEKTPHHHSTSLIGISVPLIDKVFSIFKSQRLVCDPAHVGTQVLDVGTDCVVDQWEMFVAVASQDQPRPYQWSIDWASKWRREVAQ
jgi:hypothetical protein